MSISFIIKILLKRVARMMQKTRMDVSLFFPSCHHSSSQHA
jgi:hypothetical protein